RGAYRAGASCGHLPRRRPSNPARGALSPLVGTGAGWGAVNAAVEVAFTTTAAATNGVCVRLTAWGRSIQLGPVFARSAGLPAGPITTSTAANSLPVNRASHFFNASFAHHRAA